MPSLKRLSYPPLLTPFQSMLKVDTILELKRSLICPSGTVENYVDDHGLQSPIDLNIQKKGEMMALNLPFHDGDWWK